MDLDEQIEIKEDELKEFAEWVKCDYVLTSAWENRGIEDCFKKLVKTISKDMKPVASAGGKTTTGQPQGDKLTNKDNEKEKKDDKEKKCCGG
jgi:hypothetical protein